MPGERHLGMTTAGGLQCLAAGDGFPPGTCRMPGRDHLDPGMPESRPIGVLGTMESWPAGLHRPDRRFLHIQNERGNSD